MKRLFLLMAVFALVFLACDTSTNPVDDTSDEDVVQTVPENTDSADVPEEISNIDEAEDTSWQNDARTQSVDAASYKWMRKPSTARGIVYNIADGDPIAAYCTEPGWAYMFYDDQAVIGYEPFPDRVSVMHDAVRATVEVWNMQHPDKEWGYINVPMPAPPPPDTSNDPVLGKWQACFCLDDGSIVMGPITAEFEWNWIEWKTGNSLKITLESYNMEHDPDAHIVWGPDE